ncbi:MAG: TonB-dependent receptor [Acidobacteriia bacterium]|nr:TonB-dependent receptor [Terriglobia bacterium]
MRSLSTLFSIFLIAVGVFGQANNGRITGTISDPAGAVIPAAAVEVKNMDTGVVSRGGASETGNYVISVPSGSYELTVTVTGFKKFVQQNVQVVAAVDTRRDVKLEVGSATDVVTVQDTAPLLKTESAEVSHLVEIKDVNELPVLTITGNGLFGATMGAIRNPLQSVTLLPGVNFSNDNVMVVNGLPSNSEAIRIEGQEATGNIWKMIQSYSQGASVDAIQEVNVQTSNFAAEYGQVGGGSINYTMKSGTNQLHGSAYDYFVNEAFNAGLPFTDAGTQSPNKAGQHIRNALRRNDYGFTVGGPIAIPKVYDGHDKTFFFFNFEQFRESRTTSNSYQTVPTAAYRAGDFSTSGCFAFVAAINSCVFSPPITYSDGITPAVDPLGQTLTFGEIFDPKTNQIVNGAQVRSPFPGQKIPLPRYDPVALKIQDFFPLPNQPGISNNYLAPAYANWKHDTNWSFKLDHSISPTIKLGWYFSRLQSNSPNANSVTEPYNAPNPTANRNVTTRVNYDQTLRPTLLLHIGVGYIQQYQPTDYPNFDQSSLGMKGYFQPNRFPSIGGFFAGTGPTPNFLTFGMVNLISGGYGGPSLGGIGPAFIAFLWEEKPTANINLTWVKGNHSFKYGGDLTIDGYPEKSGWRANGAFGLSNAETADPWQNGQPFNYANASGFSYASFMLGLPDNFAISPNTQTKTGQHSLGLFFQDTWKVTRKLTLDYGLRYDFQTYLKEQYGRMPIASFSTPNPTVGGRLGAVLYGTSCKCDFSHNYPWALGPRIGAAYQINPKTVLRAGAGVTYGVVQTPNGLQYSLADYYTFNSLGYGLPPATGAFENNPYPNVTWPNFDPGKQPILTAGLLPPSSPNTIFNSSARPPRTLQWSLGVQRELTKDIVVDVSYVANRGVWWSAEGLDTYQCNCLNDQRLALFGLSRNKQADLDLLTSRISSPQAIARGFVPAYPGMPPDTLVNQQIRPFPQWASGGPTSFLGPPRGKTWYDSLQTKMTKRFSHGLSGQASFVWAHATDVGAASEAPIFLSYNPVITDIFNNDLPKQLNQLVPPVSLVISGSYTTPRMPGSSLGARTASWIVQDWQLGMLLRYQNGALISAPSSSNQLMSQLLRQGGFNGTPLNLDNRVAGVNPLAVDPNCGCFNPQTTLVLNPKAWADPAPGQWGTSAPFTNDYRWQRQPAESMSFARNFPFGRERRFNAQFRMEFQNIFNRHFLSAPQTGNQGGATAVTTSNAATTSNGAYNGGYGYVATIGGAGAQPRSGQAVLRVTF